MAERFTIDEYLALFAEDGAKLELWDGEIRIGGEPFYDFVTRYLAHRGETVCPITMPFAHG
jgi:hypothetical protein